MRLGRRGVASVWILVTLFVLVPAPPAWTAPGKCDTVLVLDSVCEVGKSLAGKAGAVVTAPVRWAAGSAVDTITSWVADTAQWILGRVVRFIENSTSPTLDAGWFAERYRFMIGLAALVLLPMLLIATIRSVVTQDVGQLTRSFFLYLPIAILGTSIAVNLTQALLGTTDGLSAAVARNVAGDVSEIFDSVGGTLSKASGVAGPVPSFALFLGALLLIVGAFFVWLELLIRSAAVTVAVFFLPMILAGLVWPAAMRWTKRLIEILFALILSKFVIVAVISLATAALADPGGGGFGTVMGAAALMLMAAFSPFALLKLMPMVEGAAIDQLQGKARAPVDTFRPPYGGMHQVVSVMRAKTRGHRELAVAGSSSAGAGGAAAMAGAAAAQGAKAVAKSPGQRAERQSNVATSGGTSTPEGKPLVGGGVTPPTKPNRTTGKDEG